MRPAKRDIDPDAKSHAGKFGDFEIRWVVPSAVGISNLLGPDGWYVITGGHLFGPFHTSQAAFCAIKDAIDDEIMEKMK